MIRDGDQCLAGINTADKDNSVNCTNGCLFNVSEDPSERNDLINDTKYTDLVEQMEHRLRVAGEAALAPSEYFTDPNPALDAICQSEVRNGYLEPLGVNFDRFN